MAGLTPMTLVIDMQVRLTLWQAIKLRIGGARLMEGYLKMVIEDRHAQRDQEADDAA